MGKDVSSANLSLVLRIRWDVVGEIGARQTLNTQAAQGWTDLDEEDFVVGAADIGKFARRHALLIACSVLICLAIGVFALMRSTLIFASTVVVSAERGTVFEFADMPLFGAQNVDDVWLMTQAELVLSDLVVTSAAEQLNLAQDTRYLAPGTTYLDYLRGYSTNQQDVIDEGEADVPLWAIVRGIQQSTVVDVVRSDALLQITHYATDPEVAADVANAIARAFSSDGLSSKLDATTLANQWIQTRIDELEQSVRRADEAVQRYRDLNNLEGSGSTSLVREDLVRITQALSQATSSLARVEARYDSLTLALLSGEKQTVITEALKNVTSTELRRRYLEAQRMASELAASQGPEHEQTVRYQEEMRDLERLMAEELGRVRQGISSQVGIERSRVETLQSEFQRALNEAGQAGAAESGLRELEREYSSLERLYTEFLARYQETLLRIPVPINEAAIISPARAKLDPVLPRPAVILIASLLAGLVIGTGIAAFIQIRDKSVLDAEALLSSYNVDFVGALPKFGSQPLWRRRRSQTGLHVANGKFSYAIDHPMSPYAETLRRAYLLMSRDRDPATAKMIGVTSVLPMEGKSTFAINLSLLLAKEGRRVLLVDASLSRKNLTSTVAPGDLLTPTQDGKPQAFHDEATGLNFLSVIQFRTGPSSSLDAMHSACLEHARSHTSFYDVVIIDMPDLNALRHHASTYGLIESLIMLLAPRKIARRAVLRTLSENTFIRSRRLGAVLNLV